jgi:hypothetical protein
VYVCVRFHSFETGNITPETLVSGVLQPWALTGSAVPGAHTAHPTRCHSHTPPSLSRHVACTRVLDFTCDTSARPQLVCRRARTAVSASRGFPSLRTSFRCMARKGGGSLHPAAGFLAAPRCARPESLPPHAWSTAPPRMVHCPPPRMVHGGTRRSDSSTVTPHSHRPGKRGGTDRATSRGPPYRRAA